MPLGVFGPVAAGARRAAPGLTSAPQLAWPAVVGPTSEVRRFGVGAAAPPPAAELAASKPALAVAADGVIARAQFRTSAVKPDPARAASSEVEDEPRS